MSRSLSSPVPLLTGLLLWAAASAAAPVTPRHELASTPAPDPMADGLSPWAGPAKVATDTTWIADWTFDSGGGCTEAGWVKYDPRSHNDGSNYWTIEPRSGSNAAVLAKHDLCWARDGYGNNWDYSIVCEYRGASALSFVYAMDAEPGFDFVYVEIDSAGASESRAAASGDPRVIPSQFRTVVLQLTGYGTGTAGPLALSDFGVPSTIHEVYIRFVSDGAYSDEDGLYPSTWNAGLVTDDIQVTGGLSYAETFDGTINIHVSLRNTAPAPLGVWARVFPHATDNDKCTENTTCSWIFTDPDLVDPITTWGPGGTVVNPNIDNIIESPWVDLAPAPGTMATVLSYRLFGGQTFATSKIILGWSVRSGVKIDNTDTSAPGDSLVCPGPWQHAGQWSSLESFRWTTVQADMTPYVASPPAVQVRFRVANWNWIVGQEPPSTLHPGPGPYIDRVRIGRLALTGPALSPGIDTRSQAQDCFPTVQNAISPGEHHSPASTIFGSCAFSMGGDLAINGTSPNLVTGDSIAMTVADVRGAGGITEVRWFGAITRGPHTGKSPVPYVVGANGFFEVTPDSARGAGGAVVADRWFVDLDDTYFRGGDELLYFWTGLDAGGGRSSHPAGITAAGFPPASVGAAELATGGLHEVSFLPAINWAPTYLAAIAADGHGDIDPTPEQIAISSQKSCILYWNAHDPSRLSGDTHRTSFMYTLDRLGYRIRYDVYDYQGLGNTNNQLGGRANVAQCAGYALVIHDAGRGHGFIGNGVDLDSEKIDQAQWYRDYLAQGATPGGASIASLWLLGEDTASFRPSEPLIATDFGLATVVGNQSLNVNPNVTGQGSFSFSNGNAVSFAGEAFALNGGCPEIRDYDGATGTGTAAITHRYTSGATTGTGAVVMNKNGTLDWNTIWMGFGWFDIRNAFNTPPASGSGAPDTRLAQRILNAVLPIECNPADGTDVPDSETEAVPAVSALHPNVPNPFNPTTTIRFDLARDGRVRLRVFDVAGKLVATLVDDDMRSGFGKSVTWNGLDARGARVPSGVYFYRLETGVFEATRKMVVLK